MHTGNHYGFFEAVTWTRRDIYALTVLAVVPTALYDLLEWTWLGIPWIPIAMIGTAAAFLIGFKNTQTYNRLWEARQIYGAIVNSSRTWGIMARDYVNHPKAQKVLIYRHIAWLTALRFQLREERPWENMRKPANREYSRYFHVAERIGKLEDELKRHLSASELDYIWSKKNRATQIIALQSRHLKQLHESGGLDSLQYVEMENLLANLYDQQGKCERIKNFPYPSHFASANLFFVRIFCILVPFGLLNEFDKIGPHFAWLTIPFSVVVTWVFSTIERVGEATANPFEGGSNDIPITALSRTIEIDLLEMLDEHEIPAPIAAENNILM